MKKIALLVLFLFNTHFLFAQNKSVDIKKEISKIYGDFQKKDSELNKKYLSKYQSPYKAGNIDEKKVSDSLHKIDFEKYYVELSPYKLQKIESLKKLLGLLNEENPMIGKITVYSKDKPEEVEKIDEAKKNPEYSHLQFIGITTDEQLDLIEDKDKIQTIRKDFVANCDSYYFSDSGANVLSAKISFVLDDDGYFKKIKPVEGNKEFAYFCAISLYMMHKKYEPTTYKGKPVLTRYQLPVKMQFE